MGILATIFEATASQLRWLSVGALFALACGRLGYEVTDPAGLTPDAAVDRPLMDADGAAHQDGSSQTDGVVPAHDGGQGERGDDGGAVEGCDEVVAVVILDGALNCSRCANDSPVTAAQEVNLPAGSYTFVPLSGAVNWLPTANAPWAWRICMKVPANNFTPVFETSNYNTSAEALDAAKVASFRISVASPATAFFTFADVGCTDNVGVLRFAICAVPP